METTAVEKNQKVIEFNKEIEQIMNKEKALSYSSLKAFLQSPKHFFKYKTEKETTPAMNEGKIFHMAVLEPDRFKECYWVLDDTEICEEIGGAKPRGTKAYKEWRESEIMKHSGQEMISQDDYDLYMAMGDYLKVNSATRDLMSGLIDKERPIEFEYNDFKISGFIDGIGRDYIVDLKKVADASFKKVRWIIQDMMLDMQAGIYCSPMGIKKYYLIFVDKSINVTVVKLSPESIQEGFNKFEVALSEFRRCAEEDLFNSSYEFFNNGYVEV